MVNNFYIQGLSELVFYFTIYAFYGWLIENTYNLITNGKFIKANYLIGPFKPMYGLTAILLISIIKPNMNWLTLLLICLFVPIIVEFLTGFFIYKLFFLRYWDYRGLRFQIAGHVCLLFSLYWVVLSFCFIKWIHPVSNQVFLLITQLWSMFYILVIIYFLIDFVNSTHRHFKIRRSLNKLRPRNNA